MAGETVITIVGNLTADPELRWIGDGTAVASFTIASTPRTFDRASNSWKDGEAIFMRCSAWRDLGENCAESLKKGMRVVAQGRLQQRSWESQKSGERHTSIELTIDEIGPSLRYATAHVERNQRREGHNQSRQPQVLRRARQDPRLAQPIRRCRQPRQCAEKDTHARPLLVHGVSSQPTPCTDASTTSANRTVATNPATTSAIRPR